MIYTWYSFRDLIAYGLWFIAMNYTIHSIMYSYYLFRALRFNIPKSISICITSLQLLQMVVGIYVNIIAGLELYRGRPDCHVTPENIIFSFLLYFSFFLLFFHYFINTYMKKAPSSPSESKEPLLDNIKLKLVRAGTDANLSIGAKFLRVVSKKIN